MTTVAVQTRVPKFMKSKVVKILANLGLDLSSATRIFYAKIIQQNGLPFAVKNEPEVCWNLTEEEERLFQRQAFVHGMAELWNCPEDDVWDEWAKNAPSIATV